MNFDYLLAFSDEYLTTVVLPYFPLHVLENLCSINNRLSIICKNEDLWRIKTNNSFSIYEKPLDITSWKNFYLKLALKPLYYHGDKIALVPLNPTSMNETVESIKYYIGDLNCNIAFLNQYFNSIIVINYPSLELDVKNTDYNDINRIVIVTDLNYNKPIPIVIPSRGRNSKPKVKDLKEEQEVRDRIIIFQELTSPLSKIPVFGTITGDSFRIIDNRGLILDPRTYRIGRFCNTYMKNDLINLMTFLGIQNIYNFSREELCTIIMNRLDEIGHLIHVNRSVV